MWKGETYKKLVRRLLKRWRITMPKLDHLHSKLFKKCWIQVYLEFNIVAII